VPCTALKKPNVWKLPTARSANTAESAHEREHESCGAREQHK